MKFIIDRFEGDYAILEDDKKKMHDMLIKDLPKGIKEGDLLVEKNGTFTIDKDGTEKRRKEVEKLMHDLWK